MTPRKAEFFMASGSPKKRKSPSPESNIITPKKKKLSSSPSKKTCPGAQDGRACTLLTKLIDSGVVADHEQVFYLRKRDKTVMKEGALTREGVLCACCGHIFLLSRFEVHAGSGLHRPSANMFLKDGRSLMECQQAIESGDARIETLKRNRIDRSSSIESTVVQANSPVDNDVNDNICQLCGDGGQLILCDTCPSAFHADCLYLDTVPDGEWHCPRCRCGACGDSISNGGVTITLKDHLHSPAVDHRACLQDDNARVSTRTIISCAHCQVPYHVECVTGSLQEDGDGHWFCTNQCEHVFKKLRKLVGRPFLLDRGLSWVLIRSSKGDRDGIQKKNVCVGFERKLSEAYKVMQKCFDPVIDYETGVDLLSQTLFNKTADLRRLDCSGFYTMLLIKGEQLVSVATFRVHGQILAEMPFIGTKDEFRQQGMCKTVMKALESMLVEMGVNKLIIPSVDELLDTWRDSFGFRMMNMEERKQVSHIGVLPFVGTTFLQKMLKKSEAVHVREAVVDSVEDKKKTGLVRIRVKLHVPSKQEASSQPISCY